MPRHKEKHAHLPPRLRFKHGAFYYVTRFEGRERWFRLGEDYETAMFLWSARERQAGTDPVEALDGAEVYRAGSPPPPTLVAIYALHDPRSLGVRYIGQARNPYKRLSQHLTNPVRTMVEWIESTAPEGPIMRVIEWTPAAHADEIQRLYIRRFLALGASLLNRRGRENTGQSRIGRFSSGYGTGPESA